MADDAQDSPPGDSPFRGGFRFLESDERVTVDVWGSDLTEVLPRMAEAVFHAAGSPETLVPAPPFRVEARGADTVGLVASLTATLLGLYHDQGRFASVAACRSVVAVQEGGTLPPGIACVLLCEGGHVDSRHDPGLRQLHVSESDTGVWEEQGILRARFHLDIEPT